MYRFACTVVALTVFVFSVPRPPLLAARLQLRAPGGADAVAFALAFRAGRADTFTGEQISGVGTSFHGPIAERLADGSTRTSLVMTLGAVDSADPKGKMLLLDTWDEFVAAERARTTLSVALSGPDLPAPPTSAPAVYEFSGVYDGQVRTVPRAAAAGQTPGPDRPCPGEQPRDGASDAPFYCAPLLTGATATLHR
jgi:hypothetical protein